MHLHISWIKFRFDAPQEMTEAQYAAARERPDELRSSISAQVAATVRKTALLFILMAVISVGCFLLAARFDFTKPGDWSADIGESLVMVGCVVGLSALFTLGSCLHYSAAGAGYCRAVTRTARDCESYPDFAAAWTRQQQLGIGVDRKLRWWLPWLALTGALVTAYFVLSPSHER